jgi:DNA repair protein RecO (recombination protein O)
MSGTHKTKSIILKTVPYGETSLIVTALTELFGVQTYIIKGVRTGTNKQSAKAGYFQPGAILEMLVYHHPLKTINFVKEFKWAFLYKNIYQDIFKNAVALYLVELLQKCGRQPEENPVLFYFAEDILQHLDGCSEQQVANFPLFVTVHLPSVLGIQIIDNYDEEFTILDLHDGRFVSRQSGNRHFLEGNSSKIISQLLKARHPEELDELQLSGVVRNQLLHDLEIFYQLHIPEFGKIRTLPVLHEILN